MDKKIILSGAQATGDFTLGNYLGAILHWTKLQQEYESYFFIADLHSITLPQNPEQLRAQTISCATQYLACGLDPEQCAIFAQSKVKGHLELAWVLACLTPIGQLQRMTQFKEKIQKATQAYAGLLYYPVLQAADILLYDADLVPVGEDQKQHLELTRDLAEKFNASYAPQASLQIPEPLILGQNIRLRSLQNPSAKMSKSDTNTMGTIFLFEDPKQIRKKIQSAVTDSENEIRFSEEEKPGLSNLLSIYAAFSGETISVIESQFAGKGYGHFKSALADLVIATLEPVQARYQRLCKNRDDVHEILKRGAEKAQVKASAVLDRVYKAVGFA